MSMMATSSREKEQARDTGPPAASMPILRISAGVAFADISGMFVLISCLSFTERDFFVLARLSRDGEET
jgi:hypothetical protein